MPFQKPKKPLPPAIPPPPAYPMRINKYLGYKSYCTRREGDALVEKGRVLINGVRAKLGDKVMEADNVEVRLDIKHHRYIAYNKPRDIVTHSPGLGEQDVLQATKLKGVFPIGRLDKDSHGLIILTDDGRITDKLLNPDYVHEKEYVVTVEEPLASNFKERMERGVRIEDYETKPCRVTIMGERKFSIILTEGKKHQIRRMCSALGYTTIDLERRRVMNLTLAGIPLGEYRPIEGDALKIFLRSLGLEMSQPAREPSSRPKKVFKNKSR